jgi:F0F1-type ATP synthase membrane subunit b/b'
MLLATRKEIQDGLDDLETRLEALRRAQAISTENVAQASEQVSEVKSDFRTIRAEFAQYRSRAS